MKKIILLNLFIISSFSFLFGQDEITWLGDIKEIPGPAKYGRMVLMKQGPRAGQILLTYQEYPHGRKIVKRYSADDGETWTSTTTLLQKTGEWSYANCNIIELEDGRLLMTYQKRRENGELYTGRDRFVCVKYSTDGGDTWSAEEEIFQGGNWEPMPIQIPTGIYIFFTLQDIYPTTYTEEECQQDNEIGGRAVAFVASFDNGETWTKFSDERYGAKMLLRDYNEENSKDNFTGSGGGMPTPFLTDDNRFGFIAESIERKTSPWIVLAPAGDHTFESEHFTGIWQTVNYNGINDNNVYPASPTVRWALTTEHWGGAPFALKLSNGKIAFSYNSGKRIHCWVANSSAKSPVQQARPFGDNYSFYSSMINLNDSTILIAAHETSPGEEMRAIYLRKGRVKDYVTTSISKQSTDFYTTYSNGLEIFIENLEGKEKIGIYHVTGTLIHSFQSISEKVSFKVSDPGVYIMNISKDGNRRIFRKVIVNR